MELANFLAANRQIDWIEIVSYPPLPPRAVGLHSASGRSIFLTTDMHDLANRTEIGSLKVVDVWTAPNSAKETRERFAGGRVLGVEYMKAPHFDAVSGAKINMDTHVLLVAPGDAPYSLYVEVGGVRIGRPEYALDSYDYEIGKLA